MHTFQIYSSAIILSTIGIVGIYIVTLLYVTEKRYLGINNGTKLVIKLATFAALYFVGEVLMAYLVFK